MKKVIISLLALVYGNASFCQSDTKIDTANYHQYYSPKGLKGTRLTTGFLRLDDVVPIMLEELKNAGHEWLYDRTIYKLKNGQRINISAYSRKSNIGFLYIGGHGIFPGKSDREILFQKDNSKVNFVECEETFDGQAEFVKITELPVNIFVLKEDCYFFQYTDNPEDNKRLVTKEIAKYILRQDIRQYLSNAGKL